MNFAIDADTDGFKRAIGSAVKQWGDLKPHLTAIGDYMESVTDERFDRQRSPSGKRWAALSPAYAKRKARNPNRIKTAGILEVTGKMRRSIRKKVLKNSVSIGVKDSADEAVKTRAAVHQSGSPSKNIPARPYLGITAVDKKEILGILSLPPGRLMGRRSKK